MRQVVVEALWRSASSCARATIAHARLRTTATSKLAATAAVGADSALKSVDRSLYDMSHFTGNFELFDYLQGG